MVTFTVSIDDARAQFPEYEFLNALTPSAQKSAFHVRRDGRDFCLKIISPNHSIDRVQREVLAMQAIDHANVVKVLEYECSAKGGTARHYLVEEFIAGTDLSSDIKPGVSWPVEELVTVFAPICDGLAALQAKQIVHRDLKPSNVRVSSDGTPVIIDFGLARLLDLESLTLTAQGAGIGTPAYFAPEQFKGTKHDIDHRTDLYAVGAMMYEAATGKHPSLKPGGMTYPELSEAVCTSESYANAAEFTALLPALRIIIQRLLAKERVRRPASASLVATMLRKIGAQQ